MNMNMRFLYSTALILHTLGLSFWKVGSRKIYAVPRSSLTDNEIMPPKSKRRRPRSESSESHHVAETLESLTKEVQEVKEELIKFNKLCFKHKFSACYLRCLNECFSCCICKRSPVKPRVGACSSCRTMVGCQRCVNGWYAGLNSLQKVCPKCRTPRGLFKTFVMKGFDEFISQEEGLSARSPLHTSSDDESVGGGQFDDTLPIVFPAE